MAYTRCLSLPVVGSLVLASFVYYTVIVLVIKPWLGLFTANGLLNAASYTLWFLMVLWCYALSLFRDPGPVPPKYAPELEDGSVALQEVKRKGGELRFCQKCACYKPPRAHHCRICKRCVLRMDHHCIWINNCVGHRNYKAFVLFVLFDVVAIAHGLTLLLAHAAACLHPSAGLSPSQCLQRPPDSPLPPTYSWMHPSPTAAIFFRVLCIVICIPLGISLLVLLLWHFYLIALNKTTIEMASLRDSSCRKCKSEVEEDECGHGHAPASQAGQHDHNHHHDPHGHGHGHVERQKKGGARATFIPRLGLEMLSRRSLIAMFLAHYEGVRARLNPKAADLYYMHPYDLGLAENMYEIMGSNPLLWLCPNATSHLNSGLRFPTAYDTNIAAGHHQL